MSRSKAFTFGVSREAYEKVYIPSQKLSVEKNLPGPGHYTLLTSIGKEGRKYSLQGRTPYHKGKIKSILEIMQIMYICKKSMPSQGQEHTSQKLTQIRSEFIMYRQQRNFNDLNSLEILKHQTFLHVERDLRMKRRKRSLFQVQDRMSHGITMMEVTYCLSLKMQG